MTRSHELHVTTARLLDFYGEGGSCHWLWRRNNGWQAAATDCLQLGQPLHIQPTIMTLLVGTVAASGCVVGTAAAIVSPPVVPAIFLAHLASTPSACAGGPRDLTPEEYFAVEL